MILRWLATAGIAALIALALALPSTDIGRRGSEAVVRADAAGAVGRVGERLPDFALPDLHGAPVRLSDLRGRRVLLTFERSVDW
jgi:cytochrome oxidase Cu insertion factor (SCO1/SenC/PrrC family)